VVATIYQDPLAPYIVLCQDLGTKQPSGKRRIKVINVGDTVWMSSFQGMEDHPSERGPRFTFSAGRDRGYCFLFMGVVDAKELDAFEPDKQLEALGWRFIEDGDGNPVPFDVPSATGSSSRRRWSIYWQNPNGQEARTDFVADTFDGMLAFARAPENSWLIGGSIIRIESEELKS
jgi:hypothetical protein